MGDVTRDKLGRTIEHAESKRATLLVEADRRSNRALQGTIWPIIISFVFSTATAAAILFNSAGSIIFQLVAIGISLLCNLAAILNALLYDSEKTQVMRQSASKLADSASLAERVLATSYPTEVARLEASRTAFAAYQSASEHAEPYLSRLNTPSIAHSVKANSGPRQ